MDNQIIESILADLNSIIMYIPDGEAQIGVENAIRKLQQIRCADRDICQDCVHMCHIRSQYGDCNVLSCVCFERRNL